MSITSLVFLTILFFSLDRVKCRNFCSNRIRGRSTGTCTSRLLLGDRIVLYWMVGSGSSSRQGVPSNGRGGTILGNVQRLSTQLMKLIGTPRFPLVTTI